MVESIKKVIGTNRMVVLLFGMLNVTVIAAMHCFIVYEGKDNDLGSLLIIAIGTQGTLAGAEIFKQMREMAGKAKEIT